MMFRRAWVAGTAALLVAASTFAITGSAQAKELSRPAPAVPPAYTILLMQCDVPSNNALGFTPALTLNNVPTVVQRTTSYRKCAGAATGVTSGYEHKTINMPGDDCTMVLLPGNVNFTITWNTTQTSTIAASRQANLAGNTLTVTFLGTVTAGLFAGANVKQVFTANTPELAQCLAGAGVAVPFILSDVNLQIYR